ncbi:uncharacterized protein MELLADRAFT_93708 [Melampsora larici-populina 98AG31]|uniref:Conserved oligomeric Golgi complex subunit 1 n=1 Tax=Melampsora larici-populina (strain 98AG31 / pathotype 3-4-7) TaxID=747676 RepID=F4S4Z6_MELLP|nr:uncharacterized protein MELLADRAFT_93708 [Melampsora larici-populina 98AG31]EGG00295.1 hypothetical protein MELLADRAFT_93708 [Melampsora larici-populina 98AG31]
MSNHFIPNQPSPSKPTASSISNTSPPPTALRSRPSVLSFTSLAPSDSRSNPQTSTPFHQAYKRRLDAGHMRTSNKPGFRPFLVDRSSSNHSHSRTVTEDDYIPIKKISGRPEELDLLTIEEPDELFQTFTIREIRLIAQRARSDAEKKQEELREMVGERYRDLLGAADAIVRMKSSSSSLCEMLYDSMELCNKSELKRRGKEAESLPSDHHTNVLLNQTGHIYSTSTGPSSRTTYTLATLVKLILVLSEHIWRSLEREDFLSAARFDALGRIISSELTSGRWDETGTTEPGEVCKTFPIVVRQSEALAQLAPQIAWRARGFLRRWDVNRHETASALAAILLLDNTSLMDTATLFLQARRTSLNAILASKPLQPDLWTDRIRNAIRLVIGTLQQTFEIFGVDPKETAGSTSYFVRLLQAIQDSSNTTPQPSGSRKNDTLDSKPQKNDSDTIRLNSIISMLPNAHQSMRYLPKSVITFSPFIPVSLDEPVILSVGDKMPDFLNEWCQISHNDLLKAIHTQLESVQSTSELVEFRSMINTTLQPLKNDFITKLHIEIHDSLSQRFDALYALKLNQLKTNTLNSIQTLKPNLGELNRKEWIFSNPLPLLETSNHQTFETLIKSIRQRTEGRFGESEGIIIGNLEDVGKVLKHDFEKWRDGNLEIQVEKYVGLAKEFMNGLVDGLDDLLKSEDIWNDLSREVMIGDIALQISATETSFMTYLALSHTEGVHNLFKPFQIRLASIASNSLSNWITSTAQAAVKIYTSDSMNLKREHDPKTLDNWPSDGMYATIDFVAQSLAGLGPHRLGAEKEKGLVSKVLEEFFNGLTSVIENLSDFEIELIRYLGQSVTPRLEFAKEKRKNLEVIEVVIKFLIRIRSLWFPILIDFKYDHKEVDTTKQTVISCVKPGQRFALLAL